MDSINPKKTHAKTLLAGNDDGNVVYCESCNVLELSLGALTLRLNPESLHSLSSVLNLAKIRLDQLQNYASAKESVQPAGGKIVH